VNTADVSAGLARPLVSQSPPGAIAPYSLLDYYLTSIVVGLKSLPGGYAREAAARILNPLSYPRLMEYQLTVNRLPIVPSGRLLDLGSPKLPALLVARHAGCEMYLTDIRDYFIGPTAHFLRQMGMGARLGKSIQLQVQDARALSYRDATFDWIYSVSVLEHIPDEGDQAAIREIARVLRPGGLAAITVPFTGGAYREDWVAGDVFEREGEGRPNFYQRHYDQATLRSRLIEPSGLEVVETAYFGEPGVRFEPSWNRVPMTWKAPLLWAQPFLAQAFLRRLRESQLEAACGAAVILRKPGPGGGRPRPA
jgi:SAM-dependent methyltransferase